MLKNVENEHQILSSKNVKNFGVLETVGSVVHNLNSKIK